MKPVKPKEIKINPELVGEFVSSINKGLLVGNVAFEIPINYLLLEEIRRIYTDWLISSKEYKKCIKLYFSAWKAEQIEIIR